MAKQKKLSVLSKAKNAHIKLKNIASDISSSDVSGCKIELHFNKEAIVDGCKGIVDYSDTRISLNVEKGLVIFDGCSLNLYSFDESNAVIRGLITNISFNT